MIVQEILDNGLIRTYSNAGFKIHGGYPEGDYDVSYDPEDSHREFTETTIPVDTPPQPGPGYRELSRVKLYRRFRDMGIWDQVKAWMQQTGSWEEWDYSTTLEENNQLVKNAKEALKTSFGLTDEIIEDIISNSIAD